jgi:hypothetical protein
MKEDKIILEISEKNKIQFRTLIHRSIQKNTSKFNYQKDIQIYQKHNNLILFRIE